MAKLLQGVIDRLEKVEQDIETIELGVYGDSKNEVHGLIQNVRELQKTVKTIQDELDTQKRTNNDKWKKIAYFLSGAGAVIGGVWIIVQWVINKWITNT